MAVTEFIKQLRTKQGFSQEYMAQKLKISRPTYAQVEQGARELTISQAKNLAGIFDLPLEKFLAEEKPIKIKIVVKKEKQKKKKEGSEIRISVPQNHLDKFKAVLMYILKEVGGKPNVGMTVLYKLLYFIDFDYYEKHEEQLIGAVYIKNHFGPTPVLFSKIINELQAANQVEPIISKFYQRDQKKYLINPDYEPDLSLLSAQEIKHIDDEIERLSDMTANELTEYSHKDVPWITAENGQPLDYESVFYRSQETSVRDYGNSI